MRKTIYETRAPRKKAPVLPCFLFLALSAALILMLLLGAGGNGGANVIAHLELLRRPSSDYLNRAPNAPEETYFFDLQVDSRAVSDEA